MAEALAERLLDLHGRLLSLYVLQGNSGETGSSSVRMWWLYMQGTNTFYNKKYFYNNIF